MILTEFHFLRPYGLLLLVPYALIVALMTRHKLSQGNWASVCDVALLPYLLQKDAIHQSRWPLTAGALAAFLVILALAGPTWDRLPSPAFRNDAALIIALDLSRSMDAGDIKPSRLTMARFKITDILKQRKDGQTALLVYAGDAFTVTPLTNDTETIASQLSALNTDIMPSEGSNTSAALEKAMELFKQAGLQKGHILLVTDGVDVDNTLAAVNALGNFKLSVLGVGTADGAPIALPEGGFLKDRQGGIIVPKLDQLALEKLANAGHGSYQTLSANDSDIHTLLSVLDTSKQQAGGANNSHLAIEIWNDRGPWLLLLAIPLAAMSFRKGVLCFVLLVSLPFPKVSYALEWQDLWKTKDQQGVQAYDSQNFAKAANSFENKEWKAAAYYKAGQFDKALALLKAGKTSDDFYNKGNALAQEGKLEEALKAYNKALSLDPNNADAKYNKELVAKELEKQKQQREQQKQDQQKQQQQQQQQQQEQNKQQDQQSGQGDQKQQAQNNDNTDKDPNKPDESQANEQNPQQKPEQTKAQAEQDANQQKTEPTPEEDKQKAQEKAEQDAKAKAEAKLMEEQKQADSEKSPEDKSAHAFKVEDKPYDEKQQANEQWLKRIPDDPAGLLKRKFKYQYGQREHPARDGAYAW